MLSMHVITSSFIILTSWINPTISIIKSCPPDNDCSTFNCHNETQCTINCLNSFSCHNPQIHCGHHNGNCTINCLGTQSCAGQGFIHCKGTCIINGNTGGTNIQAMRAYAPERLFVNAQNASKLIMNFDGYWGLSLLSIYIVSR